MGEYDRRLRAAARSTLFTAATLAALVVAAPSAIRAQQLSPERLSPRQRQVWERETTYWRLWKAADVEGFMALWDPHLADWPHATSEPVDHAALLAMVQKQFEFIRAGDFDYELHPLSVTVVGDVAVTFYTVHTTYRTADGTESSGDSRLTHTWLRADGTWRIVGGMSASPVPEEPPGAG
ncbi:MAG: nuclear transport factor 2 family protein [Candidatus Palauibacterales bacterium]|nr:nuclear transport factor 2 family protein [Candidatus Palauibacterales bacterium]MDP2529582.1 nuclear transport factor 2 family protein [Candidatus Palauibacterales bacterium]MDP2582629.1 nuclear transport factor 2 family protein [Candidatus Palauibacterales bacterium]